MPDNKIGLELTLDHLQMMANAVDLPVNADFENGFSDDPEIVAHHVKRACETGIAGLSIEDSTQRADGEVLLDIKHSVAKIRAARRVIDEAAPDVLLVARAEGFFVGRPDLDDVIARLTAYAEAGADCLYAPGLTSLDQVAAVVKAIAPKPINVLVAQPGFTVASLAAVGVRRISVGGALARTAWGAVMRAVSEISEHGTFESFASAASGRELNTLMSR